MSKTGAIRLSQCANAAFIIAILRILSILIESKCRANFAPLEAKDVSACNYSVKDGYGQRGSRKYSSRYATNSAD
jgi:hypothetical protein